MPDGGDDLRSELEVKLREVEKGFARQMRERGFDPAQAENIALPGPLAKLYAEREELRAELEKLEPGTPECDTFAEKTHERG